MTAGPDAAPADLSNRADGIGERRGASLAAVSAVESLPRTGPTALTQGDRLMRRVLFLPADAPPATRADAQKAFQTSIMVAAVRCVLMYLVFPFVLPAIGVAKGVGPVIGLAINAAAMVCIVLSMRRFWRAEHPKRWWYGVLGGTVFLFLLGLAVKDVISVL